MLSRTGLAVLGVIALSATPAFAVTVTNQDNQAHSVTVDRGSKETQESIGAGKSLKVDCPDKCGFYDQTYGFSRLAGGSDQLVIDKTGQLHFQNGHGDLVMPKDAG